MRPEVAREPVLSMTLLVGLSSGTLSRGRALRLMGAALVGGALGITSAYVRLLPPLVAVRPTGRSVEGWTISAVA